MCYPTTARKSGTLHHVIQRRNDGSPCFFNDDDYFVYLDYLKEAAARHRCQIHCYVLMPDHVQLLVNPDAEHRLSRMLRCVGGRYVEYVNYIYQRHGAFWEHGPNATLIDSERCLLACYRSIESTPVRARLAEGPADYRWSSYNHHAHGREDAVILDHRSYLKLGATQRERQLAYHELFRQPSDDRARAETLAAANRGPAPSGDRFKNPLERLLRRARPGGGGRPGAVELAIAAA